MRVLVACEFSGVVRDAFIRRGHEAMSCDLLPTEKEGPHYEGDVRDILNDGWDLMIAHPPCTFLSVTSNQWHHHPDDRHLPLGERRPHPKFPNRAEDRKKALDFIHLLLNAPIERVALENPVGAISTAIRKPDQIIQPWQFGHGVNKKTCLWLKNLPPLVPTEIVEERTHAIWMMPPGKDRWKERSRTFQGIAAAMAEQWGAEKNERSKKLEEMKAGVMKSF